MNLIKSLDIEEHICKKASMFSDKYEKLNLSLYNIDMDKDFSIYKTIAQEMVGIEKIALLYQAFKRLEDDLEIYRELDSTNNLEEIFISEANHLLDKQKTVYLDMVKFFENADPKKHINKIFVEIRAGVGGDEASLFASELSQMYLKYAETKGFISTIVTSSYGDQGGFKEIIIKLEGNLVYSIFQFESGVHRVQRVPDTETQGRVHTSTCTVAVLPVEEANEDDQFLVINPSDLRIDTFKASGAGGQHVNKTDSAVRIVHLPTKIKVECQNDRSQHRNREEAMQVLRSRLVEMKKKEKSDALSLQRKTQMGTGDRSERIRTYNYPQKRITDHRLNITMHKLDDILSGNLEQLFQALNDKYNKTLNDI